MQGCGSVGSLYGQEQEYCTEKKNGNVGERMSLMINLEDAIKVLHIEDVIKDDDEAEWFRNVLEQKCYIIMKRKSASWIDLLMDEIDEVMNAQEIAKHIADGTLHGWLSAHKDVAMAKLEMLASQEESVKQDDT